MAMKLQRRWLRLASFRGDGDEAPETVAAACELQRRWRLSSRGKDDEDLEVDSGGWRRNAAATACETRRERYGERFQRESGAKVFRERRIIDHGVTVQRLGAKVVVVVFNCLSEFMAQLAWDAYALETALLLNGSMILDQCISISRWGDYMDDWNNWNSHASKPEYSIVTSEDIHMDKFASSPGEAITMAQEVVKTMVAKGYVLGKDAFVMAKAFDESLSVSSTAAAKIVELSNKIGLTDTINSGIETFKSVDEKYHVTDITKSAATVTGTTAIVVATVTGRAAMATGSAIVNSSYFAKGALWVSDMLNRAAKAAADLGQHEKK
ncbi:hypothetical protein SESBI_14935 [Sesbania bispinosa]|nr:hypothetical protein SESBI_14935 [Sesbania bispinosa]